MGSVRTAWHATQCSARLSSYDATRLRGIAARFTAPVYPGEEIRFELWRADARTLRLRARVMARDAIVLDNGVVEID